MKSFLLKAWKDPVWSKVISAGLIFIFAACSTWITGLWPEIKSIVFYILSLFVYEVVIPVWALCLIVPFLVLLIPFIHSRIPDREPAFINYKADQILGIDGQSLMFIMISTLSGIFILVALIVNLA